LHGLPIVSTMDRAARLASAPSPCQRGSRRILRQAPWCGKLYPMSDDLLFLVLAAAALSIIYKVWQVSLDAREAANRIARDTCSKAVVQFLDDTVAFAGFRLTRDARGRRRFLRTYTFDYTNDGFERAQGFVILAGLRLEAVGLAGD
jgi:hypothetical protein